MNPIDLHIGRRLRECRTAAGMTQHTLAQATNVDANMIADFEAGRRRIGAAQLFEISRALEAKIAYFYEGLSESGGKGD